MSTNIHPTAVVDPGAELGYGVDIGPYAVIEGDVQLGDDSKVDAFVQIKSHTRLGRNNHIHSHACIGGDPQDLKFKGDPTRLEIGDHNCIREYVTVNRGTVDGGGVTRLGSHCLIMAYAHIAHDCQLQDHVVLANAATLAGHVVIEKNSVIGGLSAIHQFVRIGKNAYVGGMTGVPQDVPPFMLIAGERGWLQGLNVIGLKRTGYDKDRISALKQAFRVIWRSGLRRDHALDRVLDELGHIEEVHLLADFIKSSERGVISPRRDA